MILTTVDSFRSGSQMTGVASSLETSLLFGGQLRDNDKDVYQTRKSKEKSAVKIYFEGAYQEEHGNRVLCASATERQWYWHDE